MTTFIDCKSKIPEEKSSKQFYKNGWISPTGDFYGFDGAKHEIAAQYIMSGIIVYGVFAIKLIIYGI